MLKLKKKFIEFALKRGALQFGDFYLKSGRKSPYFFNSSVFYNGSDIFELGKFYSRIIMEYQINIDILFGLAYKGISIVTAIAIILKKQYKLNIPYFFNRKEIKKYGETGIIVGNQIKNKNIIIIDDVITSGITIEKSIQIIHKKNNNNNISSIFIALNREEYDNEKKENTIKKIKTKYSCKIFSIINIHDLINYLYTNPKYQKKLKKIIKYHEKNGIKNQYIN